MRLLIVLTLLLLSHAGWAATVGTRADAVAFAGGPEEAPGQSDSNQATDPSSASAAAISPHAGASADASADFGVIKVIAQQNSPDGGFLGAATATGRWTEIMSLSSGSSNGQEARITMAVTLQGFISPVGSGRGSLSFNFDVRNAGTSISGAWDTDTPVNATGFPNSGLNVTAGGTLFYSNIHEVTATITLGDTFVVEETLSASASKNGCHAETPCLASEAGAVDIDFGHSSYWSGITSVEVRDPITGLFVPADISQFTLTSNSGTDYSRSFVPVPLPAAAWLFATALVRMVSRGRRKRIQY